MKTRDFVDNAWVQLDPDGKDTGVEPFYAWCDMSADGAIGITEIGHQFLNDTHVQGKEGICEFSRSVEYDNATLAQLTSLIDTSGSCTQDIRWRCHSAAITSIFSDSVKFTYWTNRDGQERDYWEGSDSSLAKCACGIRGDCDDPDKVCNCDSNDAVWRQDYGVLRNKQDLPVTGFCAGDTGGDMEQGYFRIGKLKCFG
ncbi:neurexin-4-like [Lineus longissimus]|uniref:neurexin-4-like n=1 Tax=Lineus longissimus TaxID=88925 RepID=UPI002B4E42B5